jgi:hypothetical protein
MSLELSGQVVKLLPEQSGQSQRGPWKKRDFILETNEQYPKKVAITCWGEKVDEISSLNPGTPVTVGINIESREYNDRWYTDIKAWRIDVGGSQPQDNTNTGSFNQINENPGDQVFTADETEGDLPF